MAGVCAELQAMLASGANYRAQYPFRKYEEVDRVCVDSFVAWRNPEQVKAAPPAPFPGSLFAPGSPLTSLVGHVKKYYGYGGKAVKVEFETGLSEWHKHRKIPVTHAERGLTLCETIHITFQQRYEVPTVDMANMAYDDVRNRFDYAVTDQKVKELNSMARKWSAMKKRKLNERCVTTPVDKDGKQAFSRRDDYNLPGCEGQAKKALDRSGVTVSPCDYPLSLPTMMTTSAVSVLTLMLDHGKRIEDSYYKMQGHPRQPRVPDQDMLYRYMPHDTISSVVPRIQMFECPWSSMSGLERYLCDTSARLEWGDELLLARIGGFHGPAMMSYVRGVVGGDVMEFGLKITIEIVGGHTYFSLKYTPGTEPVDPVLSEDEHESEGDPESALPSDALL